MSIQRALKEALLKKQDGRRVGDTSPAQRGESRARPSTSVSFVASAPIMPARLARQMENDPQRRLELEETFTRFLEHFEKDAATPHNVAGSAAFFIVVNYSVACDTDVPEAHSEAFRQNIADVLKKDPQFAQLTDVEKQEVHETLALLGMLVGAGYKRGIDEGDKKRQEMYISFAKENLLDLLGVSTDRLKFTKRGLIVN